MSIIIPIGMLIIYFALILLIKLYMTEKNGFSFKDKIALTFTGFIILILLGLIFDIIFFFLSLPFFMHWFILIYPFYKELWLTFLKRGV